MKLVLAFVAIAVAAPPEAERLPQSLELSAIRSVGVQHDGRFPPLDTVARDYVESITGQKRLHNRDSVLWLLSWTFEPQQATDTPLIDIGNRALRKEIGLPADKSVFSFNELVNHQRFRSLVSDLSKVPPGQKLDPLQSKVSDIHGKLIQLQTIFQGQAIRTVPDPSDPLGVWQPIESAQSGGGQESPVQQAWKQLRSTFLSDDRDGFSAAVDDLRRALAALPAALRPSEEILAKEIRYNAFAPFRYAWQVMALGALMSLVALLTGKRWIDALALVGLVAGFSLVSLGIWLRWEIAGRIPASNMYESLLFLGWGVGAFAVLSILLFRHRLVPLTASMMAALSLLLSDVLPVDHFVRPIAPVLLDTAWMAIHVPTIMVSYSVLALAVLIAHVQIVIMATRPRAGALIATMDGLHYWYAIIGSLLLTAGIITGSMWAAASWGRYWGWDPKEVWSLVALLGYLTILHVRIDLERVPRWGWIVGAVFSVAVLGILLVRLEPVTPMKTLALAGATVGIAFMLIARGRFATAVKSILCFWLIIMTYVGVNYVLGIGLHSYGFGTGAVARMMILVGCIDLSLVLIAGAVYLVRTSPLLSRGSLARSARTVPGS